MIKLDNTKLIKKLNEIDGKSYGAYKSIKGRYRFDNFELDISYVQGDPFASPSLVKIVINLDDFGYGELDFSNENIQTPFEDYISRIIENNISNKVKGNRGSGKSGRITIYRNSQAVLKRSSVEKIGSHLEIRLYVGLPAAGRRILGNEAIKMLTKEIHELVKELDISKINFKKLQEHINIYQDAQYIRKYLRQNGYICFIRNNSILPRKSGVDERPLKEAIKFKSPKELEIEIEMPGNKVIIGMGIKKGVTIITGGGFHGKSTLLNAIVNGVYNHIPGDGREFVITDKSAFKIRAEDGRSICNLDISPFINNLPYGKDTINFNTEDASGSTSQAANIIESIEAGSKLLLIDEDTSATNFMIRDLKIQEIVKRSKEPINPFIERVNALFEKMSVSTIVVVGGIGDYFDVADTVLMMDEYHVKDITKAAKEVSKRYNEFRTNTEIIKEGFDIKTRELDVDNLRKMLGKRSKIKAKDIDKILINKELLDIKYLEQIIEKGQTNFIVEMIKQFSKNNKNFNCKNFLDKIEDKLQKDSITNIVGSQAGNISEIRKYEIFAAINRIRKNILS